MRISAGKIGEQTLSHAAALRMRHVEQPGWSHAKRQRIESLSRMESQKRCVSAWSHLQKPAFGMESRKKAAFTYGVTKKYRACAWSHAQNQALGMESRATATSSHGVTLKHYLSGRSHAQEPAFSWRSHTKMRRSRMESCATAPLRMESRSESSSQDGVTLI